ncbi:hypothetical protein PPL_07697 [Heterostelium album PN500]|uniref:Acid phosphatase n=1 Tax=Heterostelium pallidum (strain ATCC 26659 / Pp 5 / PN500) TaxID=670386 RepID=D3BGP5_HETP5|nr:hypothetical protein PPL_07697 [Heterostelium album PN500]EFA79279.1 hypothetical protein PPL_07697 [Heterostelium album PN500]|eukprot:XP_020431400.1 hypothetical protein PPL_07697 [Heterostelium album PN500]
MCISWYMDSVGNEPVIQYSKTPFNPVDNVTREIKTAFNDEFKEPGWNGFSNTAYADITETDEHLINGNQTVWNEFLAAIEPISTRIPYMTVIGNHDLFSLVGVTYRQTFAMPGSKEGLTWYSFNYNGVHFVSVSSEQDYSVGSQQYEWLKNDLKTFRENNPTSWIVVFGHRPIYCSLEHRWCNTMKDGYVKSIEHLLQVYNVDVYLSGHTHSYERTLCVYSNQVVGEYSNPKAPLYLVVGTGGTQKEELSKTWQPQPNWSSGVRSLSTGFGH